MRLPIPDSLRVWGNAALSFLYPEVCQLCGEEPATSREGFVGEACRAKVRLIEPPYCERCGLPFEGEITGTFECANCREIELHFCWARSAVAARGPILDAIHHYKYNGHLWYETFLAGLLVDAAVEQLRGGEWRALIPVPLFRIREREREFNQAERLARHLARATEIPVNSKLVKRVRATRTQTQLTREQRAENMRGAFAPRTKDKLDGGSFVVIDDVLTTGATTSACAKVLLDLGAERVAVWTLARGV
jgi:competence protein ComFC